MLKYATPAHLALSRWAAGRMQHTNDGWHTLGSAGSETRSGSVLVEYMVS